MLCGVARHLFDDVTEVFGIDVDGQLFVRILHDVVGVGIHKLHPACSTLRLKQLGEVLRLPVDFDHSCLQTRQVENVVDDVQQVVGILLDHLA